MSDDPLPADAGLSRSDAAGDDIVVLHPAAAGAHGTATLAATIDFCPLTVGEPDERGNTVKFIYACDRDYAVYYSRLEPKTEQPANEPKPLRQRLRRWLHLGRRQASVFDAAYASEGVQAQLSTDPAMRQRQRRLLLPLGNERARLQALLGDWRRRYSYDARIATALQIALDGDADGNSAQQALATLVDARTAIVAERDAAGRAQYVRYAVFWGLLDLVCIAAVPNDWFKNDVNFWLGMQAGLFGAILSIAISIRRRQEALYIDRASNLTDSFVRLLIGAVSGGTLVLLFATGLLPTLKTAAGDLALSGMTTASPFAALLGLIAGFVEQLVPSLLEKQGERFAAADTAAPPPAQGAASS